MQTALFLLCLSEKHPRQGYARGREPYINESLVVKTLGGHTYPAILTTLALAALTADSGPVIRKSLRLK